MPDTEFYAALRQYLESRKITALLDKVERKKVTRVADNYVLKDNQLFYTGPSRQYMRLVVLSDEQKRAVLEECHNNPGTGNHNGVRGTRDRVVAGYYWSSLKKDVTDWVKCCHRCQLSDPIKMVAPVLHPVKVLSNIKRAQSQQKKSYSERKQKWVRQCSLEAGDEVLIGGDPKKRRVGDTRQNRHQGPFTLTTVSTKGVAIVRKGDGKLQTLNVSRLRPYYRFKGHGKTQAGNPGDHGYAASDWLTDHQYASHGPLWSNNLGLLQNEMNIVGDCSVSSSVDAQMHQSSGSCRPFAHGESALKEEQVEVTCDHGRAGLHGDATESYAEDEREAEGGDTEAKMSTLTDSACSSASFSFTDTVGQDGAVDWSALEEGRVLVRQIGERPSERDETSVHALPSSPIASDVTELGSVHIIEDHCSGTSIKLELSDESEDVGDATGMGNDSATACGPAESPARKEDPTRTRIAGDSTETPAHTDCGRQTHMEETPAGRGGPSDFELLRARLLRGKSPASLQGPNDCKVCGRSFSLQETLRLHQLLHRLDHVYSCAVCGRGLEAGCPCGRGQCQCSDCGKSRSASLIRHQRVQKARAVCVDT
ncbi:hypothetical protein MATL_G00123340 [Megalops atlanticus]|uniref:C2H2-type domain-containing protein n=1 Tax=Megalops atlanticus TaxID=7932 RepID=A0A9D3Q315_MEGAT|nr:hypothetical protein MATL_G00123340 [Megalops atlanticus]